MVKMLSMGPERCARPCASKAAALLCMWFDPCTVIRVGVACPKHICSLDNMGLAGLWGPAGTRGIANGAGAGKFCCMPFHQFVALLGHWAHAPGPAFVKQSCCTSRALLSLGVAVGNEDARAGALASHVGTKAVARAHAGTAHSCVQEKGGVSSWR